MIRSIFGVVIGIVVGASANMAVILLSWAVFPPPEGADMNEHETLKQYVQTLPFPAFLMILLAHAGGAFVGGLIASLIARRSRIVLGAIVGGTFLIGGIMNVISIPAPLWFAVADLLLYLPGGIGGALLIPERPTPPATATAHPDGSTAGKEGGG